LSELRGGSPRRGRGHRVRPLRPGLVRRGAGRRGVHQVPRRPVRRPHGGDSLRELRGGLLFHHRGGHLPRLPRRYDRLLPCHVVSFFFLFLAWALMWHYKKKTFFRRLLPNGHGRHGLHLVRRGKVRRLSGRVHGLHLVRHGFVFSLSLL
jgi:hypothetical protein